MNKSNFIQYQNKKISLSFPEFDGVFNIILTIFTPQVFIDTYMIPYFTEWKQSLDDIIANIQLQTRFLYIYIYIIYIYIYIQISLWGDETRPCTRKTLQQHYLTWRRYHIINKHYYNSYHQFITIILTKQRRHILIISLRKEGQNVLS